MRLERRRSKLLAFFDLSLVPGAERRPRHGAQTHLVDRAAIDETLAERALIDSPERVPHLLENVGVGLGQREIFLLQLVEAREIPGSRLVNLCVPGGFDFA